MDDFPDAEFHQDQAASNPKSQGTSDQLKLFVSDLF